MTDFPELRPDGVVCFSNRAQFSEQFASFLSQGAILANVHHPLTAFETLQLTITVPHTSPLKAQGQVTSLVDGKVLLRLVNCDPSLQNCFAQIAHGTVTPTSIPTPIPSSCTGVTPVPAALPPSATSTGLKLTSVSLPAKGTFINPSLPQDFLVLPINRPLTERQLAHPSPLVILMWLTGHKNDFYSLRLNSKSGRDLELFTIQGESAISVFPPDAVIHALAEPEGSYELTKIAFEPKARYRQSLVILCLSLLRELSKRYLEPDLAAAMSGRHGQAPRMLERGRNLLRQLGLSEAQLRVATRMLNGQFSLDEILHNGVGARSSWQILYLLQVLGGLEWTYSTPRKNVQISELQSTWQRISGQDYFAVFGLHLSSSPKSIARAYQRLQAMYGPKSVAQTLSPKLADAIWTRIEEAYAAIGTPAGRRKYRQQAFPNVRLDYALSLVLEQASLAEFRGEIDFAVDLLEAALEISPTPKNLAEHQRLKNMLPRTTGNHQASSAAVLSSKTRQRTTATPGRSIF